MTERYRLEGDGTPDVPTAGDLQTTAREIVDAILRACVTFGGKFEGRGKDRALTFPLIVRRDSDVTEEPEDRMVAWVAKKLETR